MMTILFGEKLMNDDLRKIKRASDTLLALTEHPSKLNKSGVRLINQALTLLQMVTLDSNSWNH